MAVEAISRPVGYKLDITPESATVTNDGGDALFTNPGHGLSESGIYIESNIDSYNGFGFVESGFGFSTFKVEVDGEVIPFKQNAEVTYYFERLSHAWQCVHLPIVYQLSNDLYPINSVDTVEPAGSYGFINGYFAVITLNPVSFNALDYVKVGDAAGGYRIFQVVEAYSSTITVLNSDGTGGFDSIQLYRNNYHIDVNVYAGLPSGHPWESEKPYELATTLRFIPDSNNRIKFSIAEILKGYIATRNNLTLDTLPNNIDFMTAFYIEYAEGYDVSDGTEVTAFVDEFQDDDFEGYALNAMLPFKNLYSGFMSEYVDAPAPGELARWLTTMDVPLIFVGLFLDLSFINRHEGDIEIFKNGVLYLTITDPGIGILRVPIEAQNGDEELCIQAKSGGDFITESICLRVVSECDTFIADDLRLIETGPFRELE